jgi:thiamine biosynthesis lipoprotein
VFSVSSVARLFAGLPDGHMNSPTRELSRVEKSADAMGSTFSIVLYGYDLEEMEAAMSAACDEAWRLEQMLSIYRPTSEWSRINQRAAQGAVQVSPELFQLLARCLEYSHQSEGAFDISVGPLIKAWGFYRGTGRLPSPAEVASALAVVGYQHICLDSTTQTVRFDRLGMEINPGGIGKGYAVDRMVDILKQRGFGIALVTASRSSICGLGAPPEEPKGWRVDIRDPKSPSKAGAEVFLKNMSMSTSGTYEKMFWAEGRTYSHIIDPRTGYPTQSMLLVSVIAPGTLDSEVWTKPCFIHGRQWTEQHKPEGFRILFCEE